MSDAVAQVAPFRDRRRFAVLRIVETTISG
jgi:hypothetical protein